MLDKVDELKKAAVHTKLELDVRKRQEEEQKRRLAELQELQEGFEQKFNSLEVGITSPCFP